MTIDEELSIIQDNIAEYGQTNITQEEYNMIYNKAIDDFAKEIREKSTECYVDCNPSYWISGTDLVFKTDLFLDDIAEQLKEGK